MIKAWIQKYIIYILIVLIALLLIAAGIQTLRVSWKQSTIEKQEGEIALKDIDIKAKAKVISFHEKQINDNIQMQKNQQNIIIQMAKKTAEVEVINNQTKCMGVEDEKYLFNLYGIFNNTIAGMSSTGNNSGTSTEKVR